MKQSQLDDVPGTMSVELTGVQSLRGVVSNHINFNSRGSRMRGDQPVAFVSWTQ